MGSILQLLLKVWIGGWGLEQVFYIEIVVLKRVFELEK